MLSLQARNHFASMSEFADTLESSHAVQHNLSCLPQESTLLAVTSQLSIVVSSRGRLQLLHVLSLEMNLGDGISLPTPEICNWLHKPSSAVAFTQLVADELTCCVTLQEPLENAKVTTAQPGAMTVITAPPYALIGASAPLNISATMLTKSALLTMQAGVAGASEHMGQRAQIHAEGPGQQQVPAHSAGPCFSLLPGQLSRLTVVPGLLHEDMLYL